MMTDSFKLGSGATPLIQAIFRRDDASARKLIQSGADVNVRDSNGRTALHYLCQGERWYFEKNRIDDVDDLLLDLLASGAVVNAIDDDGNTPLHLAASHQSLLLAEMLIAAGADVMRRNLARETPLAIAQANPRSRGVTYFRELMERQEPGSGVSELLPAAVYVNPMNGEAITTTRQGFLAKWQWNEAVPECVTSCETDYRDQFGPQSLQLAVLSAEDAFLIAHPRDETIEIRRWDDLSPLSKIAYPDEEIMALAASPDGHWLAIGFLEKLILVERATNKTVAHAWAGEMIDAIVFDEASNFVGAICFTGADLYVVVYQIQPTNRLTSICKILQTDWATNTAEHYGEISSIAINHEKKQIAIFVAAVPRSSQPPNEWRGHIVMCDLHNGERLWMHSIQTGLTNNEGFSGKVLYLNPNEATCNAAYDSLIVFDAATGDETRRIALGHNHGVRSFSLDRRRNRLWTISGRAEIHIYDV